MVSSVPVSIVSSEVIEAAAPDNPSDELITDDAATAPPEPVLAPVAPTPVPPVPTPAPTPTPTPRPTVRPPTPTPPRPTPPRPTPPRASPTRPEPRLDLSDLTGPARPSRNPGRPATGQQGAGRAAQATGPQLQAIMRQVTDNWSPPCDTPGARELRVRINLTISADGRITSGPRLLDSRSDPIYRATADGALRAISQTTPFDVPADFRGAEFNPTFNVEQACRNR